MKSHLGLSSGLVWSLANAFTSVPVLQKVVFKKKKIGVEKTKLMLDTGQSLILSNLQNVVFEIDMWDLSRENNSSTVSCLVKPAPQVC